MKINFRTNTKHIRRVISSFHAEGEPSSRPMTFRGSSLPFCPRAFWFDRQQGPLPQWMCFKSEANLSRGTALHSTTQKWLGRTGLLYGDWSCPVCGAEQTNTVGPHYCPEHRKELVYREYWLSYKGFRGYADGLILLKDNLFALLEIKTMNSSNFLKTTTPKLEHFYQANAYAGVFRASKNLNVNHLWLWYVSADYPGGYPKVFELDFNQNEFNTVMSTIELIKKQKQLPERTCKSKSDKPYCLAKQLCWRSKK